MDFSQVYKDLDKYIISIKNKRNDYDEVVRELNNFYTFLKVISLDFYKDGKIDKFYNSIINRVFNIEESLSQDFILESMPIFRYKKERQALVSAYSNEDILKWVVNESRRRFMETEYRLVRPQNREDVFKRLSMIDRCGNISDLVKLVCLENGIECKTLLIYPGFDEKANLYNGYRFHYFNIIKIRNEEYIVDLSYRQFFLLQFNTLNRIGVVLLGNSYPGRFMTLRSDRLKVAREILKNGFIELNDITGKCYFDGFALSFRNGHYYEQTKDFSYTTVYTLDDYRRFLNCEDSQIEHEGKTVLKLQTIPIKDPYLDFSFKK